MDRLLQLVEDYKKAKRAWEVHTSAFYSPFQLDEPLTPGERRADERMRRVEDQLRKALRDSQEAIIAEAVTLWETAPRGGK